MDVSSMGSRPPGRGVRNIDARRLAALREWLDRRLAEIDAELGRESTALQRLTTATFWAELRRERRRVDAAIARMREGAYGQCCRCGVALSVEQLHVDPAAANCMDCEIDAADAR